MNKYDGIGKAETVLSAAEEIKYPRPNEKKRGGYLRGFCARFLIAGVLCGAAFGLKYLPWEFTGSAAETVKSAFTYDPLADSRNGAYLTEKIEELLEKDGGGE